jgi:hypothetical protein
MMKNGRRRGEKMKRGELIKWKGDTLTRLLDLYEKYRDNREVECELFYLIRRLMLIRDNDERERFLSICHVTGLEMKIKELAKIYRLRKLI